MDLSTQPENGPHSLQELPRRLGRRSMRFKVRWFNPTKGYGFIEPDDGGQDVFIHIRAAEKAGLTTLPEGARISYELFSGRSGKMSAENLRVG